MDSCKNTKSLTKELRIKNKEMFNSISSSYDVLNRLLSFGLDLYWRKKMASFLPKTPLQLLDVATGTCDQLLSLMNSLPNIHSAIGIDPSIKMLEIGEKKIAKKTYAHKVTLKEESIDALSFEENQFDAITLSFGIRNVIDVPQCLNELHRVLKKEGKLLILEFSLPSSLILKKFHLFYLRKIVPKVGSLLSKNREAYTYLNQTIETFPYGNQFCSLLEKANFKNVKAHPLSFGIVTIYEASK